MSSWHQYQFTPAQHLHNPAATAPALHPPAGDGTGFVDPASPWPGQYCGHYHQPPAAIELRQAAPCSAAPAAVHWPPQALLPATSSPTHHHPPPVAAACESVPSSPGQWSGIEDRHVRMRVTSQRTVTASLADLLFTPVAERYLQQHSYVAWCKENQRTGGPCTHGDRCAFAHVCAEAAAKYRGADAPQQWRPAGGSPQQWRPAGGSPQDHHGRQQPHSPSSDAPNRPQWWEGSAKPRRPAKRFSATEGALQIAAEAAAIHGGGEEVARCGRPGKGWAESVGWLRQLPCSWARAAAAALELCIAAQFDEHTVDLLTDRVRRMVRSADAAGNLTLVDVSYPRDVAERMKPRDLAACSAAVAERMGEVGADLRKVRTVVISRHVVKDGFAALACALPEAVSEVDLRHVEAVMKSEGVSAMVSALRLRNPRGECVLRVSIATDIEAEALADAIAALPPPLDGSSRVTVQCSPSARPIPITQAGRRMLASCGSESVVCTLPTVTIPPRASPSVLSQPVTELQVVCCDINYANVDDAVAVLQSPFCSVANVVFSEVSVPSAEVVKKAFLQALLCPSVTTVELHLSTEARERSGGAAGVFDVLLSLFGVCEREYGGGGGRVSTVILDTKEPIDNDHFRSVCALSTVRQLYVVCRANRSRAMKHVPQMVRDATDVQLLRVTLHYSSKGSRVCGGVTCSRRDGTWELAEAAADEADDELELVRRPPAPADPPPPLPHRRSCVRMVAEAAGGAVAEDADVARITAAADDVRGWAAGSDRATGVLRVQSAAGRARPAVVLESGSKVVLQRCDFAGVDVHVRSGYELRGCSFRGCSCTVDGGAVVGCTLLHTAVSAAAGSVFARNTVVAGCRSPLTTGASTLPRGPQNVVVVVGGGEACIDRGYEPCPAVRWAQPEEEAVGPRTKVFAGPGRAEGLLLVLQVERHAALRSSGCAVVAGAEYGHDGARFCAYYDQPRTSLQAWVSDRHRSQLRSDALTNLEDALHAYHSGGLAHGCALAENVYVEDGRLLLGPGTPAAWEQSADLRELARVIGMVQGLLYGAAAMERE